MERIRPTKREEKKEDIRKTLLGYIQKSDNGAQIPPIRSLMKQFGVSQLVIQNIIEEFEKKRLIESRRGAGIFVRKKPNSINMKYCIGVVLERVENRDNCLILSGIQNKAVQDDINIALFSSNQNAATELEIMKQMKAQNLNGIIIIPTSKNIGDAEFVNYVRHLHSEQHIPLVFIEYIPSGVPGHLVKLKNYEAAKDGLSKFLENNKKISIIKVITCPSSHSNMERLSGAKAALSEYPDIKVEYLYIDNFNALNYSEYKKMIAEKPDVILNLTPSQINQIISSSRHSGLTPGKDVKIISFVESDYKRHLNEEIFCIVKPSSEIGYEAMAILEEEIKRKSDKSESRLEYLDLTFDTITPIS